MNEKKVFISYSHDSDEHREKVLALSERLRQDGIQTLLDNYVNGSPQQGWPRWMLDQLDAAHYVLIVCSETYYRRFRGHEAPGKGKGVDWEGALITQEIYDCRTQTLKFVPIFLSAAVVDWIPEPLRSRTYYVLTSESGYHRLYDCLLDQAGVEPQPLGTLKPMSRRKGTAMTFDGPAQSVVTKVDISRIIKYAPAELIGRETETKVLNDAWDKVARGEPQRANILTFVALGGEGKTSLVAKWAADLAHHDWSGCVAAFAWSFYSQGTRDLAAASSDTFLKEALIFFGDAAMANSAQCAFDKGRRLAQLVGDQSSLLILDGIEPLQYAPTSPMAGELKDQGLASLLKGLAATSHGLCVVTTRIGISDLRTYRQTTAPEEKLLCLSLEASIELLRKLGVKGNQKEFETLVEDVKGHALTLNLLGSYLREAHDGDIRKRDLVNLEEADNEEQGGHAFRVMDAYVLWLASGGKNAEENKKGQRALAVLQLLGLFDRPVTANCFNALLKAPAIPNLTELLIEKKAELYRIAISRLESANLITVNRDVAGTLLSLDAHPLLRNYFSKRLREQYPGSWREAHRRLYKHLIATTKEGDRPTLEDLQPLYQAVVHGCEAGLHQEACDKVFWKRIQRGQEFYSMQILGAFGSDLGAVTCFFEQPWQRVSPSLIEQTPWLKSVASNCLHSLGRLIEAVEPTRASVELAVDLGDWFNAARGASNLCELELTLGNMGEAMKHAKQSVTYADRSSNWGWQMGFRTTLADVLHQAGRLSEAQVSFLEAEAIQAKEQPSLPLLYSLWGFRYCDLLLAEAEHGAWHRMLEHPHGSAAGPYIQSCRDVAERAGQTLKWVAAAHQDILSSALDHLTLGRAALYAVILEGSMTLRAEGTPNNQKLAESTSARTTVEATTDNSLTLQYARRELDSAVHNLRRTGHAKDLPLSLLTRACLRYLTGSRTGTESAQSDLDEAWEIAEHGPMPLHMADIHLHRARLFFREAAYPWESFQADLYEARRLIEKHGYWRRKEELEDAEKTINPK
jgi:hypothetical protein